MIISIAHQKGGVGKSMLSFNLAYYLSQYNPIIVDLDIQNTISRTNLIRTNFKLPFNIKTLKTDDELKRLIKQSNLENLVIIDTGGFDSSLNRLSIIASDLIITPVNDEPFELGGLKTFETILQKLEQIKESNIVAMVLLNKINPSMKNFSNLTNFISKSPNFEVMSSIIRRRKDIVSASGKGLAVGEDKPGCNGDLEYKQLAKEIEMHIFN